MRAKAFAEATLQEYAGFLGRRLYALPDARPGLQAGDIGGKRGGCRKNRVRLAIEGRGSPSPLLTTNFPPPVAGDLTQPAVWFFLAVIKPQLQHRMTAVPAVFKLKDVAKAAGMDPRRLSTFLDRKLIECDRPGTGRPRHFTTDDAARIGLLNRFLALRLPPSVAARLVVVHFDTSGLLALEASGHARRIESKDQLPMNGGGVILIDMGESYRSVVERLKAAA